MTAHGGAALIARTPARRVYKGERSLRMSVVVGIVVLNVLLLVIPIGIAFVGSFHQWNPLNGTFNYLGLDNYTQLLGDARFWTATANTGIFGVVVITLRVALGLALAYAVWSKMTRFKTFFRTLFYMPTVTPLVAVAYVWKLMYHPQVGAINSIFGFDVNWLFDSQFALPAIMLMTVWKDFGYAVILFLAGLYSLPEDALEAAGVDGASAWQRFRLIVLPLLRPMMLFVVVTSIISYLQAFVQVMVLTKGGPGTSTSIISYLVYEEAFVKYNFGYASAIAFVLLILTALLTLVSFKMSGGRKLFGKGA
ncbi:carbohydrate ABC transporter permease [Cellulomonas timonensis]|uniref:carbohydrate ABC transporter permease n=1 Tax=Cellulomonas timonensis TaxID=1689271 RepID=UPI0008360EA2|nr:sugar ABC transporter permease [Cellulomonas timonensis]